MTSFKPSNRFKKAWSLSSLTQYEDCPEKFKFIKLDKLSTGDKSPALEFGIMVHNKLEQYLLGEIKGVPPELKKFEVELKKLLASGAVPEEELVMDKDWNAIEDGWWSKDAWWRGKTDVRLDNYVIDLKTGKHYPNHEDQAMLYSIAVFKYHPEYENIDVEFYYSKSGEVADYSYDRKDLDDMIESFKPRVKALYDEEWWLPREHQWCRWCEFKDTHCSLFGKGSK